MKFLKCCIVSAVLALSINTAPAAEPVMIVKGVSENPKIAFSGIPGHPVYSQAVGAFLKACGWFEVVQKDGLYDLTGEASGDTASIRLEMAGLSQGALEIKIGDDPRLAAKRTVDAILEKAFKDLKIKGFCETKIAFCADTAKDVKNIYICDIDGGDIRQITFFNTLCVEPSWSPDGRSVAYTRYNKSTTDIIETRISPPMSRRLTSLNGLNAGVAFSPASNKLAIISSGSKDHQVDLYIRSLDAGSPMVRLTNDKAAEASPCFSPDGSRICYVSGATGSPRLFIIPAAGGAPVRLPCLGSEAVTPDWSPDGEKLVYATRVKGTYALAVYNLKTKENKIITKDTALWESPSWAPDNRQVVCKRNDGRGGRLFVVDTLTGKARQLLHKENNLSMPSWSRAK